jgi:hypothetical protein
MLPEFQLFEVLKRHGVPFVVIGGHAVNFHGYARVTEDTDVVWLRSTDAEIALSKALTEIDAHYIGKEIDPATRIERTYPVGISYIRTHQLMMLCTKHGFFDLFNFVPGYANVDPQQLFDSSVTSGGYRYCSLDWLRKMKIASGRGKDLVDLEQLPKE